MRLIDADELKKVGLFNGKWDRQNGNRHFMYGVECVVNFVNNLPTIEAEPVKHGKWSCYYDEDLDSEVVECSKCGERFFTVFEDTEYFMTYYCPNCGADMRGG